MTRTLGLVAAAMFLFSSRAHGGFLSIEGDSTLRKWSSVSTPEGLEVRVPVSGFKSGDSGLDKDLLKAMKEKTFPAVVYRLDHYETTKTAGDAGLTVKTSGKMTIAGQTRPVTIYFRLRLDARGLTAKGSCSLKMSDYGIEPPTKLLGALKVRDLLTIRFDLLLAPPRS